MIDDKNDIPCEEYTCCVATINPDCPSMITKVCQKFIIMANYCCVGLSWIFFKPDH